MKFPGKNNQIITVKGDRREAQTSYAESLKIAKDANDNRRESVMLANLDARSKAEELRPRPGSDTEEIQIGKEADYTVKIGAHLIQTLKERLIESLRRNADLFAWTSADMPDIDPNVACHRLSILPGYKPVVQKLQRMGPKRQQAINEKVQELMDAGIIREVQYTSWVSNVVLVKKSNGKWKMCTDYTDLNKACPKDSYSLPNIDKLVDNATGYKYLSFMDSYSGYNQILMYADDEEKTTFIIEKGVFCYKMMLFGLKNAGATYQKMMNTVFKDFIGNQI